MDEESFSARIISALTNIPRGKVATYGQIALLAGNPRAARTVSWLLRSSSAKYDLPWHRVLGARGRISMKPGAGLEEQAALLMAEGVEVDGAGNVDLELFGWDGF
ncbi:MAG: MGMT family protein [bacterium]|nr:MGMT family protein [bacterium]